MAKVKGIIDRGIIRRFKGTLDFYGRRGATYVRSWPRSTTRQQTDGELLAQCYYVTSHERYWCTPLWIRDQYASLTSRMWWTRRDYFFKHYFGTIDPWPPIAWNHHPPQPRPCPGGNGHYWSLIASHAGAINTFQYRIRFWFDQPLRYIMVSRRTPPWMGTIVDVRSNIRCEMGRNGARANQETTQVLLLQSSTNSFDFLASTFPFSTDRGWWYGYIRAEHPATGHPALSLTPWFTFYVPDEYPMVFPQARLGIDFREAVQGHPTYFLGTIPPIQAIGGCAYSYIH